VQLWYFTLGINHNKADAERSSRHSGVNLADLFLGKFKENDRKMGDGVK